MGHLYLAATLNYQRYYYTPYVDGFLNFNIPCEKVADMMQRTQKGALIRDTLAFFFTSIWLKILKMFAK